MVSGYPENTLAAYRRSVVLGFSAIEIDLRATSDGHIVVMHDDTVDRTTNGSGEVGQMTLAEIQSLDAGSHADPNSLISGSRRIRTCSKQCAAPGRS
jgi:glycerophosphoryl diester phosphodiesterase